MCIRDRPAASAPRPDDARLPGAAADTADLQQGANPLQQDAPATGGDAIVPKPPAAETGGEATQQVERRAQHPSTSKSAPDAAERPRRKRQCTLPYPKAHVLDPGQTGAAGEAEDGEIAEDPAPLKKRGKGSKGGRGRK